MENLEQIVNNNSSNNGSNIERHAYYRQEKRVAHKSMGLNFLSYLSNSRIDKESLKDLFHMYALLFGIKIRINEE